MKNQEYSPKEIEELIPAYGMGMTDSNESRQVEAFLRDNPEWQAEVDSYKELAGDFLEELPQMEPPAHLLNQIIQMTEPISLAAEPTNVTKIQPRPRIFSAQNRWWLAAVAGLISIMGFLMLMYTDLRRQNDELNAQLNVQVALLQSAARDELISFSLQSTDDQDERRGGVILCNPDERAGIVRTWRFPPLEENQVYQVWLLHGEERDSGGTFEVDADGRSEFILYTPYEMSNYSYIGITVEPMGGSDAPTSNPVVRGRLYVTPPATDEAPASSSDA